jgi:hypothetical protein
VKIIQKVHTLNAVELLSDTHTKNKRLKDVSPQKTSNPLRYNAVYS